MLHSTKILLNLVSVFICLFFRHGQSVIAVCFPVIEVGSFEFVFESPHHKFSYPFTLILVLNLEFIDLIDLKCLTNFSIALGHCYAELGVDLIELWFDLTDSINKMLFVQSFLNLLHSFLILIMNF